MKLTKKQEAEILKVYNAYWDNYLKGDAEAIPPLLDDKYTQVGSAEGEVFYHKKDALQFIYDTIDQVAGKLEMRNRVTKLEQQDNTILIHELCDLYVLADGDWIFYSRFRATTLMQQKKERWKIIHQHSSLPDTKAEDGQNVAIDKIAKENLLLREAIKRRTIELENKNRELEIETALERVRARTMAMHKSEELKQVIQVVYEQFVQLNILVEHAGFILDYKTRDDMHIWLADKHTIPFQVTIPYFDCAHWNSFNEAKEKNLDFFSNHLSFEEKNKFYQDLFKLIPGVPEDSLEYYLSCPGLAISTVLLDNIGLYIENFSGISYTNDENITLMRFAKVFQQTYTRFLDLQKAEAQAREAKIEASLERTRTQSMIMQHSNELDDSLKVFHEQVLLLGINSAFSYLWLPDEKNERHIFWAAWAEGKNGSTVFKSKAINYLLDRNEPATAQCLIDWKSNEHLYSYHVLPAAVENYFAVWQELIDGVEHLRPEHFSGGLHYVEAFMKYGCFGVIVTNDLTEDEKKLLSRFAIEFERTYTRFLDLQKAEAQAREAQIEASLERVRSRTMAMQKSTDLGDTSALLFGQLNALVPELWTCGFVLCDRNKTKDEWWLSGGSGFMPDLILPNVGNTLHNNIYHAWLNGDSYYEEVITGDALDQHYDWLMTIPSARSAFDAQAAKGIKQPVWQQLSCAYFSKGYLVVITEQPCAQASIFKRFAQVFEQTYTRFLDLQKAEAQAREAQIELGLERVRARAMAMQKSDELSELVDTVFKELTKLDFALTWCIINIIDEPSLSNTVWAANPDITKTPESYHLLFEDYPFHDAMMKGWKERNTKSVYTLEGDEKRIYDDYLFSKTEFRRTPEAAQASSRAMEKYVVSFSFSNFGGLQTVGDVPLSDANLDILSRFGKVFDLTYTRFNDLKQAEAQARESQIQLALERVRARTMAMQKSDELPEAATLLFQQVQSLGMPAFAAGYCIWDEDKQAITLWMSSEGILQPPFKAPTTEDELFIEMRKGHEEGKSFHVVEMGGKKLVAHYQYMRTLPVVGEIFDSIIEAGHPLPTFQVMHHAYFAKGFLLFITYEPVPDAHDIFKRFGKVFEQTYTRFLDLQKAEAQAREAEIELALERVRSRAMAMHSSQELKDVATELRNQMNALGQTDMEICAIHLYDESPDYFESIAAGPVFDPMLKAIQVQVQVKLPKQGIQIIEEMMNQYHSEKKDYVLVNQGKKGVEWFELLKEKVPLAYEFVIQNLKETSLEDLIYYWSISDFKGGSLVMTTYVPPADEVRKILRRFANVFGLAYQRFKDLKKAEEQAKEAQIELALERVRARTMAMQHSEELQDTSLILFQQLKELGEPAEQCTIGIIKESEGLVEISATLHGNVMQQTFRHKIDEPFVMNKIFRGWKDQQRTLLLELKEEELKKYNQYRNELVGTETFPVKLLPGDRRIIHAAYFSKGMLALSTNEPRPAESLQLLERFAIVFDQTYTRFLDLQKAEAQAREAQIEAALEKVRSRSMAMHHSTDLQDVIRVLSDQLLVLGLKFDTASFAKVHEDASWDVWMSSPDQPYPALIHVPYIDHPIFREVHEADERKESFFERNYTLEEKNSFFKYFFENTAAKSVPDARKQYVLNSKGLARSVFLLKNIWLSISNYEGIPFSKDENAIVQRFANVFEQTYTRFLDLQKAEAQARQAKIEAAMEKVRSRAMAMQKPNELVEVAELLRKEMGLLGVEELETSSIYIHHEDTGKTECWYAIKDVQHPEKELVSDYMTIDLNETSVGKKMLEFYQSGRRQISIPMRGDARKEWINYCAGHSKVLEGFYGDNIPDRTYHLYRFPNGYIGAASAEGISTESWELLQRATAVFSMAYTRFRDLQQAEAQAREAKIEYSLERVRAQAMAMHKSEELLNVCQVMFMELKALGFEEVRNAMIHTFDDKNDFFLDYDFSGVAPGKISQIPTKGFPTVERYLKEIKKSTDAFLEILMTGEELETWKQFRRKTGQIEDSRLESADTVYYYYYSIGMGDIGISTFSPISKKHMEVLERFRNVFQLSYQRYIDIKKAEAQAREAQINLAVERVRARALAMYRSEEILEVVFKLKEEVMGLDIPGVAASTIFLKDANGGYRMWDLSSLELTEEKLHLPLDVSFRLEETDPRLYIRRVFSNTERYFLVTQDEDDLQRTFQWLRDHGKTKEADEADQFVKTKQLKKLYHPSVQLNNGRMCIDLLEPPTGEIESILTKMGAAFDLVYKRFEDLKNSEEQLKEAQVEAALERVRSRTIGMHKSEELRDVIQIVFEQLHHLDFKIDSAHFNLNYKDSDDYNLWTAAPGQPYPVKTYIPYFNHPVFTTARQAKEKGLDFFTESYTREEKNEFFEHLFKHAPLIPEQRRKYILSGQGVSASTVLLNSISLWIMNYAGVPYSEAENAILKRFGKIFEQSHTRFLDLQKAEAQAREAQIETSLERVRAKAMAMHSSKDVSIATATMFNELTALGVESMRCGVAILQHNSSMMDIWTATLTSDGHQIQGGGLVDTNRHPLWLSIYNGWNSGKESFFYHLKGENLRDYYKALTSSPNYSAPYIKDDPPEHHCYVTYFEDGVIFTFNQEMYSHEQKLILRRFASVFSLTYKRYKDLRKAEAQAREAQIEGGLERVRSRTLAMQKSDELAETAAEVFKQLISLGIEPNRLYIGIVQDEEGDMEMWATDEDGTKVGKKFRFNKNENATVKKLFDGWKAKEKSVVVDVHGKELEDYLYYLNNVMHIPFKGGLSQKRRVQSVAYFNKGFIGMASPDGQGDETIQLLERFAGVFNLTFTRFNDLKIAEAHAEQAELDLVKLKEEKKRTEDALAELQVTQAQLIQSEKMASLGELTAGIAHEIQNPLNFVNNFSEISNELIDEMIEEAVKGNYDQVKLLADDVKQNLQKINHHGKRADGIVKGMLQHSRSNSGQKELTDINDLADEYLRLAFHGLRAKEKNFNSDFTTDFDESVGQVNIIPQDIGRVLLNLLNNAFYAVNEKRKTAGGAYQPKVSISTRKLNDKIEIAISDNGNGIPQNNVYKIFQPFFTTKPTGQGTGLGLSLAYDIIKAHGGELKVNTVEGKETRFIVSLPIINE